MFQDLFSEKVKGIGDVEDGLHVLNWQAMQQNNAIEIRTMSVVGKVIDLTLWHRRSGHALMGVLRRINEFTDCCSFTMDNVQFFLRLDKLEFLFPFPISNNKQM